MEVIQYGGFSEEESKKVKKVEKAIDAIVRVYGMEAKRDNVFSCKIPYKVGFLSFVRSPRPSLDLDKSKNPTL